MKIWGENTAQKLGGTWPPVPPYSHAEESNTTKIYKKM